MRYVIERVHIVPTKASEKVREAFPKFSGVLEVAKIPSRHKAILMEFFRRYFLISVYNGINLKEITAAIPIFSSLINHSCDPNIDVTIADGRVVAIVNRPVKAGDQLFKTFE